MLNIKKESNGTELTVALEGRLDTTTAPEFENEIKESISDVKELVLDLSKLEYISSAGLRVLLSTQKKMNVQGSMVVRNAREEVKEIFEVTGFADILTLE